TPADSIATRGEPLASAMRRVSAVPYAAADRAPAPHAGGNPTGRSARLCRSARPRTCHGACARTPASLEPAVELRLGEKRTGQLQDLVGTAQFLVLAFQLLHALGIRGRHALAHACIDLVPLHPRQECLRHAADLRR